MEQGLSLENRNEVQFYISNKINKISNVKHFFSTRIGGVSLGQFKSMNLGIYTSDDGKNINFNLSKIIKKADLSMDKVVFLNQIHGDKYHLVDNSNYSEILGKDGDALITSTKGIAIGVFTADCVPIILVDGEMGIVAVVHGGWKGTQQKIVGKVLDYMINTMGSRSDNILAAIGPCINKCCFEVSEDVARKFNHKTIRNNKWYVDLVAENIDQIMEHGILEESIDHGNLCTMCNKELFFSYRRDKGVTGRLGAFVQLI